MSPPKSQHALIHSHHLSRTEAQMLANYVRSAKQTALPAGWVAFYRLTPEKIVKHFPFLSTDEIIQATRLEVT